LSVRLLIGTMYVVLTAGVGATLYPFILMVSGTTKTSVDTAEMALVPRFLINRKAFFQKDCEAFLGESVEKLRQRFYSNAPSFKLFAPPGTINERLVGEWRGFISTKDIPYYFWTLGYSSCGRSRGAIPSSLRAFKAGLLKKYRGDIDLLNRENGTKFTSWNTVGVYNDNVSSNRGSKLLATPFGKLWRDFKETQPVELRSYDIVEGFYKSFLTNRYGKALAKYNTAHGTDYASWDMVRLTQRFPSRLTKPEQDDWELFARALLNLLYLDVDQDVKPLYQAYLKAKYQGDIQGLNRLYSTRHASFADIPLVEQPLSDGMALTDWDNFIQGWNDPATGRKYAAPLGGLRIQGVEFMFRDHLAGKYQSVERANAALGTTYKDWPDAVPPQEGLWYQRSRSHIWELRWEYVKRNYLSVLDYMVLHGNAFLNTVVYCALSILAALLVNPIAAYALSRYKPPSAYKVLLFLMLTMAFPPMVTQIPVFLMLREFNLLNSFWALILPGLANGYSIFLLKGFFDTLPQELYESAMIDGAGELRIFWNITMSLSKPILALMTLGAFTGAYTNFMFALLICQDDKMWTIMPWLYQLQYNSCQGVMFTSLVLASVPTFVVFLVAQTMIMKGIVLPVEK